MLHNSVTELPIQDKVFGQGMLMSERYRLVKPFKGVLTALLVAASQPCVHSLSIGSLAILSSQLPSHAQAAESVAEIAKEITVRIEGATQGSGVIVKQDRDTYIVLTAWHVIGGQRANEEISIFTNDGYRHEVSLGSIRKIDNVDLGTLVFQSSRRYTSANVGSSQSVVMGSPVYVAGFPVSTQAVPQRLLRFKAGFVEANAKIAMPRGYQLIYSNSTLPGMSGGSVLNSKGELVAIHGQAEIDKNLTIKAGIAVKSGSNQAIPVDHYSSSGNWSRQTNVSASFSVDDLILKARNLEGDPARQQELLELSDKIISRKEIPIAYYLRGSALNKLGNYEASKASLSRAIELLPDYDEAYYLRSIIYQKTGDLGKAFSDIEKALELDSKYAPYFAQRADLKNESDDYSGALRDSNIALSLDSASAFALWTRGDSYYYTGKDELAIRDYNLSLDLDPNSSYVLYSRGMAFNALGQHAKSINDCRKSAELDTSYAKPLWCIGLNKYDLEDYPAAIDAFNSAIRVDSKWYRPYLWRAKARMALDDLASALDDIQIALGISPDDAYSRETRADIYYELKRYMSAINDYSAVLNIEPDNLYALVSRGIAFMDNGDHEEALTDLTAYIERDADDDSVYALRGYIHELMSDMKSACADWRVASSLGNENASNEVSSKCSS